MRLWWEEHWEIECECSLTGSSNHYHLCQTFVVTTIRRKGKKKYDTGKRFIGTRWTSLLWKIKYLEMVNNLPQILLMLWEIFMHNLFVFWIVYGAWIEPIHARETEVFHEARSCLMSSTIVLSENQLFLKSCMMRARLCPSSSSSSTPMLDEQHAYA